MEGPTVATVARYPKLDVEVPVLAYRELSREELLAAVSCYRSALKGKRFRRGGRYTIVSQLGVRG